MSVKRKTAHQQQIFFRFVAIGVSVLVLSTMVAAANAAAPGPSLTANPTSASLNATITLSGNNFPKWTSVILTWDGSTTGMPTPSTLPNGSFGVSVTVPATATLGNHTLGASPGTASASTTVQVVTDTATATPTALAAASPPATATPAATAMATATSTTNGLLGLSDNFNDNVPNTSLWSLGFIGGYAADTNVKVAETNGPLQITPLLWEVVFRAAEILVDLLLEPFTRQLQRHERTRAGRHVARQAPSSVACDARPIGARGAVDPGDPAWLIWPRSPVNPGPASWLAAIAPVPSEGGSSRPQSGAGWGCAGKKSGEVQRMKESYATARALASRDRGWFQVLVGQVAVLLWRCSGPPAPPPPLPPRDSRALAT